MRQWDSHRHAKVNAESLSEYEHDQRLSDKPTVKCDSRIGRQAVSKRCDATWREDHQARLRLENGSEHCGLTIGDLFQSRGFVRLQVLNHVSSSLAVVVIVTATSQSCDNASKKRETTTSCREQDLSTRQEASHLDEADAVLREHELVAKKGRPSWKSDAVNFKTRLIVFRRFEVIWCLRWMW